MNPLTLVKRIQSINAKEADLGIPDDASWHAKYKDSAYVFVGGFPYDLTEGDLLAVFAQYGEIVDVNLVRDKATNGEDFMWHMSNVQTWVSSALTDASTCVDGLSDEGGKLKGVIQNKVNNVAQLTSNALALVNHYVSGSRFDKQVVINP